MTPGIDVLMLFSGKIDSSTPNPSSPKPLLRTFGSPTSPSLPPTALSGTFGSPTSPPSSPTSSGTFSNPTSSLSSLAPHSLSHTESVDYNSNAMVTSSIFDNYRESIEEQDRDYLNDIKKRPLDEQCEALEDLFKGRTQQMHYYREIADRHQGEMDELVKECKRKIKDVTTFWKDKICSENCSRSAKILKNALTKKHVSSISVCISIKKCSHWYQKYNPIKWLSGTTTVTGSNGVVLLNFTEWVI